MAETVSTDEKRFAAAMRTMADLLKGTLTREALVGWRRLLARYPIDVIEEAAHLCSSTLRYFPVPLEMIDACNQVTAARQGQRIRPTLPELAATGEPMDPDEVRTKLRGMLKSVARPTGKRRRQGFMKLVRDGKEQRKESESAQHKKRVIEQARQMREES